MNKFENNELNFLKRLSEICLLIESDVEKLFPQISFDNMEITATNIVTRITSNLSGNIHALLDNINDAISYLKENERFPKNKYLEISKLIYDELEIIKKIVKNYHMCHLVCAEELIFVRHLAKKLPQNLELSKILVRLIEELPFYISHNNSTIVYIEKIQEIIKKLQTKLKGEQHNE